MRPISPISLVLASAFWFPVACAAQSVAPPPGSPGVPARPEVRHCIIVLQGDASGVTAATPGPLAPGVSADEYGVTVRPARYLSAAPGYAARVAVSDVPVPWNNRLGASLAARGPSSITMLAAPPQPEPQKPAEPKKPGETTSPSKPAQPNPAQPKPAQPGTSPPASPPAAPPATPPAGQATPPTQPTPTQPDLPSLDDLLGTGDQTRPGDPARPAGPVDPLDPNAQDLDRLLSGAEIGDALQQAVTLMGDASKRLNDAKDASLTTQRLQETIVRRLDQLLSSLEQMEQQQSSSSQQQQSQQQQQQPQNVPRQQQDQQNQENQGDNTGQVIEPPGRRDAPIRPGLESVRSAWGKLPDRVRDLLVQGSSDRFSTMYEAMTEAYYKKLAEQGKAK